MPLHLAKNVKMGENYKKCTRREILDWVKEAADEQYRKVEQLSTGVAYCKAMELLFPGSVEMKLLKNPAVKQSDYVNNLKLLRAAFVKTGVKIQIPIEKIKTGSFRENLSFAELFKNVWDLNSKLKSIYTGSEMAQQEKSAAQKRTEHLTEVLKKWHELHTNATRGILKTKLGNIVLNMSAEDEFCVDFLNLDHKFVLNENASPEERAAMDDLRVKYEIARKEFKIFNAKIERCNEQVLKVEKLLKNDQLSEEEKVAGIDSILNVTEEQ